MKAFQWATVIRPGAVILCLMVGFGILTLVGGVALVETQRFLAGAEGARGVVVDVVEVVKRERTGSGSSRGFTNRTYFHPVVRFTTAREQVVQFQSDEGATRPAYRVGDTVEVLYDPANPRNARLDTWSSRWGLATICLGLGAFGLGVCELVRRLTGTRLLPRASRAG
jgi:hypothetical protein